MSGVSRTFIVMAIVYACIGVAMGIWMGINQDFTRMHLHAHNNLIGWASLAIFGVIYHVVPDLAQSKLAKLHLLLAGLGTAIFLVGLPLADAGITISLAVVGSLMVLAGTVLFLLLFVSQTRARALSA